MVLYFKSLELHNFGSYASAKFDLTNHGFCAVTGKNLCKKDNSTSNGSGKSTPWSAICYAITGETISGLTNNLKNIKNSKFDTIIKNDLGNSSILFGNSKGVTASIIRCLWYNLKGGNIPKRIINYKPLKSFDKIKEIKITINKITFNMCCCYTISAFNELLKNDYYKKYDFIEVMACVNGCVGGGGTILCNNSKILKVNKTIKPRSGALKG